MEEAVASNKHWGVLAAKTMQLEIAALLAMAWRFGSLMKPQHNGNLAIQAAAPNLADRHGQQYESMQADLWPRASEDSQFPSLELFADHNIHPEQLDIDTSRTQPTLFWAMGKANNCRGSLMMKTTPPRSLSTATISARAKQINPAWCGFKTSS